MSRGVFVTGTDTGVGKTLASCAILRAFAGRGERVAAMKPVAAGLQRRGQAMVSGDLESLGRAANVDAPAASANPYAFSQAIAPHLAARQAGVTIELSRIAQAYRDLAARADRVVVEGAGGALVPLNERDDMLDIARVLGLPVVLVVGLKLGCINHALLSACTIRARGMRLAAWVANSIEAAMPALEGNVETLRARIAAPCLALIPYLGAQADPQASAERIARDMRIEILD